MGAVAAVFVVVVCGPPPPKKCPEPMVLATFFEMLLKPMVLATFLEPKSNFAKKMPQTAARETL